MNVTAVVRILKGVLRIEVGGRTLGYRAGMWRLVHSIVIMLLLGMVLVTIWRMLDIIR